MDGPDPFRTLALPYDARPQDVRRAFRRLARETHPDAGGSAAAFQRVHAAYGTLTEDLERARGLWAPQTPTSPYAGGLDPRVFPTCPVRLDRTREGKETVTYEARALPQGWRPGTAPPPGGTCKATAEATETTPAFGVWVVSLRDRQYRCVFGPVPEGE
ncbi:MAG: J domain-containing protein [Bacteroidota bacterium]